MAWHTRRIAWPPDSDARIKVARARGVSFPRLAAELGVPVGAVRAKAMALGLHHATVRRRFSPQDDRIIRADHAAHVDIAVTAGKLGRSPGALRQRIFHHHKDLLRSGRTPRSWQALRQYGSAMLAHGATPDQAAVEVQALVRAATAQARAAALAARAKRRRERIDVMLEQIAAGRERNAAVFAARVLGASLAEIGRAIGITRERVRQICHRHAFALATDRLAGVPVSQGETARIGKLQEAAHEGSHEEPVMRSQSWSR